jgi:hypothetical protein
MVAASGAAPGALVVLANAWMNTPVGFTIIDGKFDPASIDPSRGMFSPSAAAEAIHMTLAAYAATGFLAAGVHAYWLLRERTSRFHRSGMAIALAVGGVASILQPIGGDYAAKVVAKTQFAKLAAMEGQFRTERRAPLRIGGVPDVEAGVTRYAIEIPAGLSILSYGDPNAEVLHGGRRFDRDGRTDASSIRGRQSRCDDPGRAHPRRLPQCPQSLPGPTGSDDRELGITLGDAPVVARGTRRRLGHPVPVDLLPLPGFQVSSCRSIQTLIRPSMKRSRRETIWTVPSGFLIRTVRSRKLSGHHRPGSDSSREWLCR